jgi:hypothetical protein
MNLGTLVRCHNKKIIIRFFFKNRIKVEHKFALYKQYKRINSCMDKSLASFKRYIFFASLIMILFINHYYSYHSEYIYYLLYMHKFFD